MKLLSLITILAFLTCCYRSGHCQAPGGWAGLKLGTYQPPAKKRERKRDTRRPRRMSYTIQRGGTLSLSRRWSIGADLAFQKNTYEYDREQGFLIGTYRLSLPVYTAFKLNERHSLELGAYAGALCHSTDVAITQFVRLRHRDHLAVVPDYGLIAGLSWRVSDFAQIKFRYNCGLSDVVPVRPGVTQRNHFLETGLVVGF